MQYSYEGMLRGCITRGTVRARNSFVALGQITRLHKVQWTEWGSFAMWNFGESRDKAFAVQNGTKIGRPPAMLGPAPKPATAPMTRLPAVVHQPARRPKKLDPFVNVSFEKPFVLKEL